MILIVGPLFTFLAGVLGSSLEQFGQSNRPFHGRDHLMIVGGIDLSGVAARAVSDTGHDDLSFERLVVLAPEGGPEAHAQIRASLREAAGRLKFTLLFGDTSGTRAWKWRASSGPAQSCRCLDQRLGGRRGR